LTFTLEEPVPDETGRVKAWSGALWYRNEMYMSIFASIGL
jgi:hypothetical protein